MQLPLNVILYQLSANSLYESQNINLTTDYDGVKFFDINFTLEDSKRYLYLLSEEMLRTYSDQITNSDTFLCVCQNRETHLNEFNHELSLVLLYSNDSFPTVFNKVLTIFHDF